MYYICRLKVTLAEKSKGRGVTSVEKRSTEPIHLCLPDTEQDTISQQETPIRGGIINYGHI